LVLFHPGFATSVWIHTSPTVVMWAVRWGGGLGYAAFERAWPGLADVCGDVDPEVADSCMLDLWCDACPARRREFMVYPLCFYIVFWSIPYYLVMFHVLSDWAKRTGKSTLFQDYMAADTSAGRFLRSLPPMVQPVVYLSFHALHVLLSSGIGWIFWHSFPLHTAFLVVTVLTTIVNGSGYIFKVFSLRYYAERVEAAREAEEEAEVAAEKAVARADKVLAAEPKGAARKRLTTIAAILIPYFAVVIVIIRLEIL
jgi:hypothetical protein